MTLIAKPLRDESGAALIEFALLLPIILGTFLGVMQVGLSMQAYNALRGISADASRVAVVEYQKENQLTVAQIETITEGVAADMPYGLVPERFETHVTRPATQRVADAIEYHIEVSYTVPTLLPFLGVDHIPMSYTRPIFVLDPTL